jgi:hypothetical protein
MNVVPLRRYVDPDVVRALEVVLARAKEGRVVAVAIAVHEIENGTGSSYELGARGDMAHLVLALERVKRRLLEIT